MSKSDIYFIDTHCHIQELVEPLTPTHEKWLADKQERTVEGVIATAAAAGVTRLLTIGTTTADSALAIRVANAYPGVFASIGIHPHEAQHHVSNASKKQFQALAMSSQKIVAVGECGLDYYYGLSPKTDQETVLRYQIETALTHNLPISFHVRDAFDDFWSIFDSYTGIKGVLHSFTDTEHNMQKALERGLYVGVNGIATFTKDEAQRVIFRTIPLNRLLLETDAPYLTPAPFRGKICEPVHVRTVAEYISGLRRESIEKIAQTTTANAEKLFALTSSTLKS